MAGELGYVPGVEGEDAEPHPGKVAYTSAAEAKQYVDATGVDFLAASIGTAHGRMRGEPKLDIERLAEINQSLDRPLVIHGGTGLSEHQFHRLIENGATKIDYFTALADAAGHRIRENAQGEGPGGYTAQVSGVTEAVREEVARCTESWGSAGRAEALLKLCRPELS